MPWTMLSWLRNNGRVEVEGDRPEVTRGTDRNDTQKSNKLHGKHSIKFKCYISKCMRHWEMSNARGESTKKTNGERKCVVLAVKLKKRRKKKLAIFITQNLTFEHVRWRCQNVHVLKPNAIFTMRLMANNGPGKLAVVCVYIGRIDVAKKTMRYASDRVSIELDTCMQPQHSPLPLVVVFSRKNPQ